MKIAILGTGGVAHALGAGWKKSGHDVIFGARDASATDPDFEISGRQDALAAGDVIVNAITGAVALQAITALDTSAMRLVGSLAGEAADHLEVVRGVQLLQDREIHRPGRVSGGEQDAE